MADQVIQPEVGLSGENPGVPYTSTHLTHPPPPPPLEHQSLTDIATLHHGHTTHQMDHAQLSHNDQSQQPMDPPQLSPVEADMGGVTIRSGAINPVSEPPECDNPLDDDFDTMGSRPVQIKPKMASLRLQTRGGRMRADQDRIKSLLKEAIINMCNSGLYYQTEMRIEGLLGVTLDRREVILVNVHDIIRTSDSDDEYRTKVRNTPTVHKRKMTRPWRVTGRAYIKRPTRRAASTFHDEGSTLKKRQKMDPEEVDHEAEEDLDLFDGTNFTPAQMSQSANQPENVSSANANDILATEDGALSAQFDSNVAWYGQVEEQAVGANGDNPVQLNEHGLPLPDPLTTTPEKADMIRSINEEVGRGFVKKQEKKKRRGEYNNYTAEMRAKIGQYAVEQGIGKAMKHFKSLFGRPISESTVRCMRKAYLDAKRDTQADEVVVLPKKDRGRPLMLKEYDGDVMEYIENLRRNGAQINVQIVMDAARGVLLHKDKIRLKEFGGSIEITKAWAQSFMARKGLHGLGRKPKRKSEGKGSPVKSKKEEKIEEVAGVATTHEQFVLQDGPQQIVQQQQHQMQHHHISQQQQQQQQHQQQSAESYEQQQQLELEQHQQQQHLPPHNQQQQQQSLSQHPTPVHTPHPQEHPTGDTHNLHNMDVVCTPPPPPLAHESRNNTMVFPERQMHGAGGANVVTTSATGGDHTSVAALQEHHRTAMIFERVGPSPLPHHQHAADHSAPPPQPLSMHQDHHTGQRMVFTAERHAGMAGPSPPASMQQDPHHMFFAATAADRLNLNPVPPAHCALWPSQNLHSKQGN